MTHIPFKGTSKSVPALLGGHVDVAFSAYPSLSGAVGTKNITLLATNGAKRSAMAPDVPPVAEFIPGYAFAPTIGVYARTGTPPAILQKIASEVAAIVKEPEIIKQFETAGIEPARRRAEGIHGRAQARGRARRQDRQGRRHDAAVDGERREDDLG